MIMAYSHDILILPQRPLSAPIDSSVLSQPTYLPRYCTRGQLAKVALLPR